mmetsp:Transcript_44517/g.70787  ORF Transcript_44517/g.70787 Transcript_44517/m.70787 type:complete len:210 (+) Transcript_44517:1040-1669(+)
MCQVVYCRLHLLEGHDHKLKIPTHRSKMLLHVVIQTAEVIVKLLTISLCDAHHDAHSNVDTKGNAEDQRHGWTEQGRNGHHETCRILNTLTGGVDDRLLVFGAADFACFIHDLLGELHQVLTRLFVVHLVILEIRHGRMLLFDFFPLRPAFQVLLADFFRVLRILFHPARIPTSSLHRVIHRVRGSLVARIKALGCRHHQENKHHKRHW